MMFNLWLCRQQDDGLLHVPPLPEGAVPQPEVPARRRREVDDDGGVGVFGNGVDVNVPRVCDGPAVIEKAANLKSFYLGDFN